MEQGITARSVNRKKTALQTYFKFLLKEGHIEENPVQRVTSPKTAKRLPVYIEEHQMEELFHGIGEQAEMDFHGLRNLMVLEMFYATGMRCSELVQLRDADIDHTGMAIKVLGKRNKERIIPIGPSLLALICKYLDVRQKQFRIEAMESTFFLTDKGKKM
jgi:integrase/recombinase XerC